MNIESFQVNISQTALDDLQNRLTHTRWPDELGGVDWRYGVPVRYVRKLWDYWRTDFDWRKWEARLNSYPQYTTTIDGQRIHFLHVRSPETNALPLILTHGWPGSIFEFFKIIVPLTNPQLEGGKSVDAFHLVVPSIPGFGFSGPTQDTGWNPARVAKAWNTLMHGLGYDRYGAAGNDWGTHISLNMGRFDPDHVIGTHVTQIFLSPDDSSEDFTNPTPEELMALESLEWYYQNLSSYHTLQAQQPQTLAFALTDSPVGLLAWFCQIFREGEGIDADFVLANTSLYWFTKTIASSARMYYEDAQLEPFSQPTITPVAVAMFRDDWRTFRRLAERAHKKIIQWTEYDTGGHFAAHQEPELLVNDIRRFFRSLR